jgi:hypothetical protein
MRRYFVTMAMIAAALGILPFEAGRRAVGDDLW